MTVELVFESRTIFQVLRQEGATENEPLISLQLALTGGPKIYAAGSAIINNGAWSMTIHRHAHARADASHSPGSLTFAMDAGRSRCAIEVHQSRERYAALLEMFRGGYVSEITVVVEGLADKGDYSKRWDTAATPSLTIKSLCFEFPLPQGEA